MAEGRREPVRQAVGSTGHSAEPGVARQLSELASRVRPGQGILMGRYKITGVQAFGLLVASSQGVNRKLRDIAEHLVTTGELLTPSR